MSFEFAFSIGIAIIIMASLAEYVDSTLGMGYGTALTPLLIILGFEPLQVIPAVLLSQLIAGILAGLFHHFAGNVDFKPKTMNMKVIMRKVKEIGIVESFRRGIPLHLKVAIALALCGIIGSLIAVFVAVSLPKLYLRIYIGILVLITGIIILATRNKQYRFSWKKLTLLGMVASFNKSMSGGGYGPIVTCGQILSGLNEKNAIAITSLAEGLICFVGVAAYVLIGNIVDWTLALYLIVGVVPSVPLSAYTVKKTKTGKLRVAVGIFTILLGSITIIKVLL